MQYRNLGKAGVKVSAIGLGTNQFGGKVSEGEVKNILAAALDVGVRFIDTANVYQGGSSEESIGKALKGKREEFIIATKFRHPVGEKGPNESGASRLHMMQAVEDSLRRLGTDHIDLYQVHRWDPETPIEETMRGLDDLVRAGKVRYIGASNITAWQLTQSNALAELRGWERFVSIQPHYHMLERGVEQELIPACEYLGIGILPYFPLAGGFLTGKYERGKEAPKGSRGETSQYVQRYMRELNYDIMDSLGAFAKEREHTLTELAHAWLLAQPMVSSVISGATKVEHVLANVKGAEWELTEEEMEEVNKLLGGEEEKS